MNNIKIKIYSNNLINETKIKLNTLFLFKNNLIYL